jgi:hypothetical protein
MLPLREALAMQQPLADGALRIVAEAKKTGWRRDINAQRRNKAARLGVTLCVSALTGFVDLHRLAT